nr:hypothetical protein [Candidatus Ichthyocystis sparus]
MVPASTVISFICSCFPKYSRRNFRSTCPSFSGHKTVDTDFSDNRACFTLFFKVWATIIFLLGTLMHLADIGIFRFESRITNVVCLVVST